VSLRAALSRRADDSQRQAILEDSRVDIDARLGSIRCPWDDYGFPVPSLAEFEKALRQQLDKMGPAPRAELLYVLLLPDFDRVAAIGDLWASRKTRSIAELLIDAEEDRVVRALLVGMLRERQSGGWRT
jgi:hypothetical protein